MTNIEIEKDIPVIFITAASFPQGIKKAMDELKSMIDDFNDRNLFGISRPENGREIVYKAAVEELEPGEAVKHGYQSMIIKQGWYLASDIINFRNNETIIAKAFEELLHSPNLDPYGYCIEWYGKSKDTVRCMIRLAQ